MPTRKVSLSRLAAVLAAFLTLPAAAQERYSFEPFESIDGSLGVEIYYYTPPGSDCDTQSTEWEEGTFTRSVSFGYEHGGSAEGSASERCSMYFGEASISGEFFRDVIESLPQDLITSGFEWRFQMHADSVMLGSGNAKMEIDFVLTRPCTVTFISEHRGAFGARIGNLRSESYSPLSGNTIDFYHYDSEVLGPGPHTLWASIATFVDRGYIDESNATLVIRFDDAYCSPADLAEPFGFHDFADITAFIEAFLSQSPVADLNSDEIIDAGDVIAFVTYFLNGCVPQ